MGSLASALEKASIAEIGEEAWRKHGQAVSGFWDSIALFFSNLDVKGFKIYQDGMVADGASGLKIVTGGISQGSKNYEIIGRLVEHGATLMKTENPSLVRQEYDYVAKIAHSKSLREKETWAARYRLAQDRLLSQRDEFIARRISETLAEGETAVLFIGANHEILKRLPGDIQVIPVKDIAAVRQLHNAITPEIKRGR